MQLFPKWSWNSLETHLKKLKWNHLLVMHKGMEIQFDSNVLLSSFFICCVCILWQCIVLHQFIKPKVTITILAFFEYTFDHMYLLFTILCCLMHISNNVFWNHFESMDQWAYSKSVYMYDNTVIIIEFKSVFKDWNWFVLFL